LSTFTTTCRLALACTFTSLAAWAGEAPLSPAAVAGLELEASLARKPNVYLKLDLGERLLQIKARGVVLDQVVVKAVEAATRQPFYQPPEPLALEVPVILEVLQGPGDTDREVIAPPSLRPAKSAEEEEEEEAAKPTPSLQGPTPTPTPRPETPSRYRVELTKNGSKGGEASPLVLWVANDLPARSLWERFRQAVKEGWAFLVHHEEVPQEPPGIVLVVDPEDARRLHHLFRQGMALLVTANTP